MSKLLHPFFYNTCVIFVLDIKLQVECGSHLQKRIYKISKLLVYSIITYRTISYIVFLPMFIRGRNYPQTKEDNSPFSRC